MDRLFNIQTASYGIRSTTGVSPIYIKVDDLRPIAPSRNSLLISPTVFVKGGVQPQKSQNPTLFDRIEFSRHRHERRGGNDPWRGRYYASYFLCESGSITALNQVVDKIEILRYVSSPVRQLRKTG